jgi:hypothetical protein
MFELSQPCATIIAALIAAFLGSWVGSLTALARFKKERAFDKRLQWYERMIDILLDTARELGIARTFQRGLKNGTDTEEDVRAAWRRVQLMHLEVNRCTAEGVLFARRESYGFLWKTTTNFQELADKAYNFDNLSEVNMDEVNDIKHRLRQAANVLAEDIRKQIGLDPLGTHPRDEEMQLKSDETKRIPANNRA